MQFDHGDPIDWTVDEVVNFLCYNPQEPWSQSASRGPRPDPQSFEAALRDNFVTGEVLLQDVDKAALREDLGLKALGHISSMLRAIRYLQGNSPKFQRLTGHLRSVDDRQNAFSPTPFASVGSAPQWSSPICHQNNTTPGNVTTQHGNLLNPSIVSTPFAPAQEPGQETASEYTMDEERPAEGSIGQARPRERIIVDDLGRKRRKLDLISQAEIENIERAPTPAMHPQGVKWFMGPERMTYSALFYSPDSDDNDNSFVIVGSEFPRAQRCFVNKALGYSYRQRPIKLSSGKGRTQRAMVLYDVQRVVKDSQKHFTLYTHQNGEVAVSKERIEDWPQLVGVQAGSQASTNTPSVADPFLYLLQKYPALQDDEDICPLYGDSGSEGEFDEETWQEIQAEKEAVQHKPTILSRAEVESVIVDCVSEYESRWHGTGKQKEEMKARRLWLMAKKSKSTNQKIKTLSQDVSNLEKRLGKLQEAICRSEYASKSELRKQCQSMEQTVMSIQKNKWRVVILEREKCPPRVAAAPRNLSAQKSPPAAGDEESLYSESDGFTDLDDFIDDESDSIERVQGNNSATPTPSTSDSDNDIISPSGIWRNSKRSRRLPFRESSSPPSSPTNKASAECIDLTADSPCADDLRIETPPLNPVQRVSLRPTKETATIRRSPSISPEPILGPNLSVQMPVKQKDIFPNKSERKRLSLPDIDDIEKVLSMPWEVPEERRNRRLLLAKLIGSLSIEERNRMAILIRRYETQDLQTLAGDALNKLRKSKEKIPGMPNPESQLIMRTASLYIAWVNCVHPQLKGIPKSHIIKAQGEIESFPTFFWELCTRLDAFLSYDEKQASDKSEEADATVPGTPHKKRKREVKENREVKLNQASAQMRVALNEEQRRKVQQKMESMGLSNTDPTHQAVSFGDPIIYLDPHIGKRVKPHQLNGIQFMWRELFEDEKQQGCLLAHTMGLGKTMQVIALLVTISSTASSSDPKISQQIPASFKDSRFLILCPSSLIENWYEEFLMWNPPNSSIGPIRRLTSSHAPPERLQIASEWGTEGGVLIMSYDIFRAWISNKKTTKKGQPLSEEVHGKVCKWLLEGPSVVVADEAHKMKNPSSAISRAAMQFRSTRRIALTGSPLANNLIDYYTMVNWIAKDYLGNFVEFKANYVEPIEEGLYADSSYTERRRSLVKLQVLKEILDPKINRADITVLEGSLPPKIEFVLTVPLTQLQKAAYDSYVATLVQGRGDVGTAKLWSWLAILGLCCNHPTCFRDKLQNRASDAQKLDKRVEETEEFPGDEPITQAGLPDSEKLVVEEEQLFSTVPDMKALELSYRAQILDRIIDESINAGDKLLIFSHSLPTLNYIEHILNRVNRKYCRLDGTTPIAGRQAATKRFNHDSWEQVYLISTRAGGLGLNIPGANRVVIFDFSFNPVWEEQAIGRAYRLGQKKPVFVYRFIAGGTFEEIMYNKAVFKTQLAFRVVDKKNPVRTASKSLREYLFPAKPVPQEDITDCIGKDPNVLDKILVNSGPDNPIRKIVLSKTLEREDNDKLTEEERQGVQQALSDERLKRTDPNAYHQMICERERERQRALVQNTTNTTTALQYPSAYSHTSSHVQFEPSIYMNPPPQSLSFHQYQPHHDQQLYQPYQPYPPPTTRPSIPSSAHNDGPPPLAPDTSL
ncbi:hypothetical protein EYZ11_003223 [Aspergillus tanneri]|uniref:SNF2 family helicase/ATPase n=1 Tax=Aspergillus tanneri TaxID=1220188 RepID=A0A4S3JNY7_9EURO|nr:uncharacterized protein ATNIH1004_006311 [Aspergillus tanneri]KAA8647617.1 hypothetical protein ATNIH1004_006311 [Aspergillus tanneri]THC97275.1 hypothetical protein EYZ11_003223 [Aspergillus tanneri]